MAKKIILTTVLFLSVFVNGQEKSNEKAFDYLVRKASGDLNKDGFKDGVTIAMDTVHRSRPFKLEIFLGQPNGEFHSFFSSTKIIEPMYPPEKDGAHNGSQIPDLAIEDDKLQLDFYIKGNSRYEFRLKDEKFELMYFTYSKYDGKSITEIVFDLLTGEYSKKIEVLETSEITENTNKTVHIRPLPSLKGFKPFVNELY